ncbi:hypothetical protein [uncultured Mediterranean phage uvMED]|nr:hypothetical protein [uncultured Mediterranean phage uvMED]
MNQHNKKGDFNFFSTKNKVKELYLNGIVYNFKKPIIVKE